MNDLIIFVKALYQHTDVITVFSYLSPNEHFMLKERSSSPILHVVFTLFWVLTTSGIVRSQALGSNQALDSIIIAIRSEIETDSSAAASTIKKLKEDPNLKAIPFLYLDMLEAELLLQDGSEDALSRLDDIENILLEEGDEIGLTYLYDGLITYHSRVADYPQALTYAFAALEIHEEHEDLFGAADMMIEIADIYWYYRRFDQGIDYATRAVDLIEKQGPTNTLASAYKILSECYLEIPDYDKALEAINKSIDIRKGLGANEIELASSINSRANIYKFMGRYDEAINDYSRLLKVCDSIDYQICIRVSTANLGHVYLLKGDYSRALPYKLRALEIQQTTGQVSQVPENLLHLSQIYAGLGNHEEAYQYMVALDSVKGQQHEKELDRLTNELSVEYETEKKEIAIQQLNERVSLQRRSLILGALILAISLAAIIIFLNLYKKLRARNQENEILMREIHHRVKNNLQILSSLLNLQSEHTTSAVGMEAITEGKNRVESMGLIHQGLYSKGQMTEVNMKEYVPELCRHLENAFSSTNKQIEIRDQIEYGNMDVDYAIPLGLIINELVTNSVKYAFKPGEKGMLSIRLRRVNDELILSVADDGKGHLLENSDKIKSSFGTMLIQTLSKKLKGIIQHDFSEGYSTTISFRRFKPGQ